ncbi:MAG TPA: HhH-GPD-type base excision DNA repair protein [Acidimicrobiales bacterium]|nr:HhH-GPD-type base excision DNA repair protein [Acidimicrobiales bacterium]
MSKRSISLTGDPAADQLLGSDPLALLIGMILDQQIPMERAFRAPYDLSIRMGGSLDAEHIAGFDPDEFARLFAEKPALHRFPASMAARVQQACSLIVEEYGSDAGSVWKTAKTGKELFSKVKSLPGFGDGKARIFVALLGKQFSVTPEGWREACKPFGQDGTFMSVADIDSPEALAKVRAHKKAMKASKPA